MRTLHLRHGNRVENGCDQIFAADFLGLGFIRGDHAVAKYVHADFLDILRHDVGASLHEGPGFGRECEANRRPRARTELDILSQIELVLSGVACGKDEVHNIVADLWVHVNVVDQLAGVRQRAVQVLR